MVTDTQRETKTSRSRRDLASRLLRPHLRFTRTSNAATAVPEFPPIWAELRRLGVGGRLAVDVICCGMYRACSTWQYEVIAHLVERFYDGTRLGYLSGEQYAALRRADALANRDTTRRPRVLKSHEGDRVFARSLKAGQALAVYAYRDIRDVVFSLMHKRKLTFEQLLRQGMIHQVLANDRFWSGCPRVLVQRYEDLLEAPAEGVLALARHIGLDLDHRDAEQIARKYSQESNRARTVLLRQRLNQAGIDLTSAENAQICDATTLLHWNHMRDPDSSWRTLATGQLEAILDRLCGRWLIDHNYEQARWSGWPAGSERAQRRVSMRLTVDQFVGRSNHAIRSMSLRFPRASRRLKKFCGMSTFDPKGAIAWIDNKPTENVSGRAYAADVS